MTDINRADYADHEQLAALQTMRLNEVAHNLRRVKFAVTSVEPDRGYYRVNLDALTWADATIRAHVEQAGYTLRRYGCDSDGLYLIVSESAGKVQS